MIEELILISLLSKSLVQQSFKTVVVQIVALISRWVKYVVSFRLSSRDIIEGVIIITPSVISGLDKQDNLQKVVEIT